MDFGLRNPRWVEILLAQPWVLPVVRIALTSAYWTGGLSKLANIPGAVAEQEHFGLHPGWLWAPVAMLVEIGGSALVISNRLTWLGAGALGVLTAVAMLAANNFWALSGHAQFMAFNAFFEHLGLIAGFVAIAILAGGGARSTT